MRSVSAVLILAVMGLPASRERLAGEDCNSNGVEDDIDVSPTVRLTVAGIYPLGPGPAAAISTARTVAGPEAPLDLDGDGDLDLALAHYVFEGQCSVLLNDGRGGYDRGFTVPTGSYPRALAAADIDGDARVDLAVADSSFAGGIQDSGISLLRNGGDGSMQPVLRLSQGVRPADVVAVDLDEDADADIALVTLDGLLSWWKNEGYGTFRRRLQLAVGQGTYSLVAADLDADGDFDLVSGNALEERVAVHENGVGASFAAARTFVARQPIELAAGDLDGDALADVLAVGRLNGEEERGYLSLLWGAGGARLAPGEVLEARGETRGSSLIDLDGDGRRDIAVCSSYAGAVLQFRNRGSRAFLRLEDLALGGYLWATAAGDADGDGDDDLAVASHDPPSVVLIANASSPPASSDNNLDGLPDECEGPLFRRGDANADGGLDIADAIALLLHLFAGAAEPPCMDSLDADDGGGVDTTDATVILRALFLRDRLPPEPFGACGGDPTPDALSCRSFSACP